VVLAGTFAGSHKNDSSGYYKWDKAKEACPPGYRLPSKDEFNLFIPDSGKQNEFHKQGGLSDYR